MRAQRNSWVFILVMVFILQVTLVPSLTKLQNKAQIHSSGVLERVKAISELNTVEMYFQDIIDYKDVKYFKNIELPFTKKSFIFSVKAKVKAGVDLGEMTEEDIQIMDKATVKIRLPKGKITSREILEYRAYDEKDGLFNEVRNEDTFKALEQFHKNLEEQAIEMKIIQKAEENGRLAITQLLMALGFENIICLKP